MNVLIAGLGLLGGSIALALKDSKEYTIQALGRNADRLEKARKAGFIDRYATEAEAIVPEADLIVIGTPVGTIPAIAEKIAPWLGDHTCITDIGSTKSWVCDNMQRILGDKKHAFLGAHPMAGSEKSGFENASATLFRNHPVVLTKNGKESPATLSRVSEFWKALGMRLHWMEAEDHDRIVAMTSHLPHAVSFTMAYYLFNCPEAENNFHGIYGKGLLDTLRIAASDSAMWEDIIKTNRVNIADALEEYKGLIGVLENWIRTGKNQEIVSLMNKAAGMSQQLKQNRDNLEP